MKLTGHSSEAIHRGYTHHELAALRSAVEIRPEYEAASFERQKEIEILSPHQQLRADQKDIAGQR